MDGIKNDVLKLSTKEEMVWKVEENGSMEDGSMKDGLYKRMEVWRMEVWLVEEYGSMNNG